jgi:O-antigen/teichoic acid export membrane protein
MADNKLSIKNSTFWDLWVQKLLRNVASVKYQWLLFLYIPVIWGMFHLKPPVPPAVVGDPWISASVGLTFLGGGFITLATTRIIARTKLTENGNNDGLDTDK